MFSIGSQTYTNRAIELRIFIQAIVRDSNTEYKKNIIPAGSETFHPAFVLIFSRRGAIIKHIPELNFIKDTYQKFGFYPRNWI